MQRDISSLSLTEPVLSALVPLRDKAPQRYLEVLASALDKFSRPAILGGSICPDFDTVMYILNEFDYILNKYGDRVKGHAWTLVCAIKASIKLLLHLDICDDYKFERTELKHMVSRVAGLLNEIDRLNPSLGIIAWAHALLPALDNKRVRALMESVLGIDVVNKKVKEVPEELSKLRVRELIKNKDFMGFVESWLAETDEKAARREILEEISDLKNEWAHLKLDNDELYEAKELFNGAAEESREINDYEYLDNSDWALRVEAIKGPDDLVNLVNKFRQLYEEAKKRLTPESPDSDIPLSNISSDLVPRILGDYLVSLALKGDHETINKLLEEHWWVLDADKEVSVLTRLMLNALLGSRVELSSELEGKLSVNPEELIDAIGYMYDDNYLPALRVAFKKIRPEDGYEECKSIKDSMKRREKRRDCRDAVSAVMDDSVAVERLRGKLINYFNEQIEQILENERSGWLRELGFDANEMSSEFEKLVSGLDGKSLAQLLAIGSSTALLALMLHALINGNKELAKALALYGAIYYSSKLLRRLYLEVYKECKECCDLESEGFRLALARLLFLLV
jgi:hypothetical protein